MMNINALALSATLFISGASAQSLTKVWETKPVLEVPESVLMHQGTLYVSNVSGAPAEKNGKGFIAKVNPDGTIAVLKWATGLNAPKGLAIHGNSLFVADIDELVQINLQSGLIEKRYPAEGAVFLNDVAAAPDGTIYVGDSSEEHGALYRLTNGELKIWMQAPRIERPNGLHMLDGQLLAGHARDGTLLSIDLETKKTKLVVRTDSGIDGLKPDGKGNWLTSNWKGRTALITAEGKTIVLMNTTDQKINSADFEYLQSEQLLIIPTFFDNRVVAYKLEDMQAPLFQALDQDGKMWSLSDHLGEKYLVIYFYPAAMTGGCTKQACGYRDHMGTATDPAFNVVGISGDEPQGLKHFQRAENLNFTLLSDPEGKIAKAFGVPVREGEKTITRTVDGKEVRLSRSATASRWTFIVNPKGEIIYKNTKVKAAADIEDVLAVLKKAGN